MNYFSTFIPGLGEVIAEALNSSFEDVKINLKFDGLVVYSAIARPEEIKELKYFNNGYLLLKQANSSDLLKFANQVSLIDYEPKTRSSFRIMFSQENHPVSVPLGTLKDLEGRIASDKLFVNRANPTVEFLFLSRSEGYSFFGLRLTRHPDYKKVLKPGQLRPELAHAMNLIAGIGKDDVLLDPFAGTGAIATARAAMGEYKQILVSDYDPALLPHLKTVAKRIGKRLVVSTWDATNLEQVEDSTLDKIVTDPPWGIHKPIDLDDLYSNFLQEAKRVLKTQGVMVVLTAGKEVFEKQLSGIAEFKLLKKYDILVSGKKAAIYKIVRL